MLACAVLAATAAVLEWSLEWGPHGSWARLGAVACALLLVLRHRFPVAVLWVLAAAVGAVPSVALLTAVAAFGAGRRVQTVRWPVAVFAVAALLPLAGAPATAPSAAQVVPLGVVMSVLAVLGPGLVGVVVGQQERAVRMLRESARAADGNARLAERSRIAAEMHDLLGHRLSLISLYSGGLELALAARQPALREEAAQIHTAASLAVAELQEVLGVLGQADDARPTEATGTRADTTALVAASRATGTPVSLEWTGEDLTGAAPRLRLAVHRVLREALSNAHRHAPGAPSDVRVDVDDDTVGVGVRNGPSPSLPSPGTGRGLAGLRERVGLLGGTLRATSMGAGFAVEAVLPRALALVPSAPTVDPEQVPSRWPGVLRAAAGAAGLLVVGALLLLGLRLVDRYAPGPVPLPEPGPVRVGMDREEVGRRVGPDDPLARAAALGHEPAVPAGADCVFPYVGQEPGPHPVHLVRYCFRDDRLVEVSRFTVRR
ncbi:hypothetical protein SSPIM334S_06787 [Streptomyces spiroverticillatus]